MKRLVIDTNNLLFRVSSAHSKFNSGGSAADQAGLAMHATLMTLRSHFNRIKPDQVALSFEGGKNWRKAHTRGERNEPCVSKRLYKGNRVKDDSMIPFFELLEAFQQLAREHTSMVCLGHPELEGDDVISGYAQKFSAVGDEVSVLSADKDFIQLLKLPGVSLHNPDIKGADRSIDKKTGQKIDPDFFMYEKAFRGDGGDNVMSAYPKVRITRLKKAWDAKLAGNPYDHIQLMNEMWEFNEPSTGELRNFKVQDLFEENMLLMALDGQPQDIKQLISDTIDHAVLNHGKFSMFHFSKFCGKFGLKRVADDVSSFIPLLSGTGLKSPLRNETKIIHEAAAAAASIEKKRKSSLVF